MHFSYYQFHLSDDIKILDPPETTTKIESILHSVQGLGLVRVAMDLTSENKSISVLCKLTDPNAIQDQITNLLLKEGFAVSETIDIEELCDEEMPWEEHEHHHGHEHEHHHGHGHEHHHCHGHEHHHENHWTKATLGLVWGLAMLAISLGSFNIPMTAYYVITGLTSLMTLYLGRTVYQSAWHALLERRWDTTTLYTISTLTILMVSLASIFIPGLPMMCEAAPLVLGFWHLGEGIEHTLIDEINKTLDIRDCVSPFALLKGNPDKEVSVKTLIPNDRIGVQGGGVIPVDGVITNVDGKARLYTTRFDGKPGTIEAKRDYVVKSGMNLTEDSHALEMRVTKTFQNSYLSLIAKNINDANKKKAPVEDFANTVLKYFIPGLLTAALLSGVVIGTLFTTALALQCFISVLVSACPCALSLITPMAVRIGMKKAAEHGIRFANGKALQAAANIDTIVFDLNGTLTKGNIEVNIFADEKVWGHIALLEGHSDHPAAKSIKAHIDKKGIKPSESLEITIPVISLHSGITGIINGETFIIGNNDMLLENDITQIDKPYDQPENGSVYLVRNKIVVGQISLFDPLREDAIETVEELKRLGKSVHICTGADKVTAEKYAALLNISKGHICANTVGEVTKAGEVSKTDYIETLKLRGCKVAMVGDAANDVTAIKRSHVGIAVKSSIGHDITQKHAGIVIQQGLLFPIATAFDVAEKTKLNIIQNLFVSLTYNSVVTLVGSGVFLSVGLALNPAVGVALMVVESTMVLANLYRLREQPILSPISTGKAVERTEDLMDNTNSKVLNLLGHRPQPKKDVVIAAEYSGSTPGNAMFKAANSEDSSRPVLSQQGRVYGV